MTPSEASELSAIWKIIDNAERVRDITLHETTLDVAIARLNHLILCGVQEAFYPLGYAYYYHPQYMVEGSMPNMQCYQALKKAVQLKEEPILSRLYLAYDRFAQQEYEEALVWLEHLKASHFATNMRSRFCELKLCCWLKLHGVANSLDQIEDFAANIRSLPGWDIFPLLLLNVLEAAFQREPVTLAIEHTLELLDHAYPIMSGNIFRNLARKKVAS